jgi:hypothetical protein
MKSQKGNSMLMVFMLLFFSGSILFGGLQAYSEEWTEAQKEVWKTVEARWESIIKGDAEVLAANLHEDALIWWPQSKRQTNPPGPGVTGFDRMWQAEEIAFAL